MGVKSTLKRFGFIKPSSSLNDTEKKLLLEQRQMFLLKRREKRKYVQKKYEESFFLYTFASPVMNDPNECPAYDTKQSDGEVSVMLRLWGVRSTRSLPLLPSSTWHGSNQ